MTNILKTPPLSIVCRNLVVFLFSFLWAATAAVVPQIFFLTHYPAQKNSLLALFLIIGKIASIAGIEASSMSLIQRSRLRQRQELFIAGILILTILGFIGLFIVRQLVLYFGTFLFASFLSNFLYNFLDQHFVAATRPTYLNLHVQTNLMYQVLGIMMAPFYFSLLYSNLTVNVLVLSVLGMLSLGFILVNVNTLPTPIQSQTEKIASSRFHLTDWLFILYSGLVLSAILVFTALTIYLLKEYYHFENAEVKGGILIGATSVIAITTIFLLPVLQKHRPASEISQHRQLQLFQPVLNGLSLTLFLGSTLLFYLKFSESLGYVIGLSILTGAAYGLFLACTRYYASSLAQRAHKTRLLSIYNNLPNVAALVGFSISFCLSLAATRFHFEYLATMLVVTLLLFLAAVVVFLSFIHLMRRYPER